jgi:phage-related protein
MAYDLGTAHGTIEIDYDGSKEVLRAEKDMDKLSKGSKKTDTDMSKLGATLKKVFSGIGGSAKIGLIGLGLVQAAAGAASLGIQLAGVVPALTSILSLSSALPGLVLGGVVAMGVLKAAFAGVGDALKSAFDPAKADKFEKSLANLSPAARDFASAVHEAAPALKGFQQSLQETFFGAASLAGQVPRVVKALAQIKPTVTGLAADFGEVTRKVANFALSADSISFLRDSVETFRGALNLVTPSIVPILAGLRSVGGVGLPLITRLGGAVGKLATQFANWLTAIAGDGRLQTWINTALDTLSTLGEIAKNVGSILLNVFQAASDTGGGLLNTIASITGQFAAFLRSAEGSEAIRSLFTGIMQVASQLGPVLTTLVGALAKALGPALSQIASVVGPALLQVVQALAPAFAPLANAIADLATAVVPLIPPLAQLVSLLVTSLAQGISGLATTLAPTIALLGGAFTQALTALAPLFGQVAGVMPRLAQAGLDLAMAMAPLVPAFTTFASALVDAILPVLPQLMDAVLDLLPPITQLATLFATTLAQALVAITPYLPTIISGMIGMYEAFYRFYGILLSVAVFFATFISSIVQGAAVLAGALSAIGGAIGGALTTAYNVVVSVGASILNWFTTLPGKIRAGLAALPGFLVGMFRGALTAAATAVGFGAGLIVGFFTRLLPRIGSAIAALPAQLAALFARALGLARAAVSSGISTVVSFFANLPRRARAAASSLGSQISSLARSAMSSMRSAVSSGINNVISFFRGLPGRVRGALGSLGGLLRSSGSALISGLINGIQSGIGRVLGMVRGLAGQVKGAFNSALSIFSPSKEFEWSGEMIGEGLVKGVNKSISHVVKAAKSLASSVIKPTLSLPDAAHLAAQRAAGKFISKDPVKKTPVPTAPTLGPYHFEVDGHVLATIIIDAVTGNPTVVSKAAKEGSRRSAWAGSGR